jgi:predicted small metal-binding protein
MKSIGVILMVAVIGLGSAWAQMDNTAPPYPKDGKEVIKPEPPKTGLKSVSCTPDCGFMVRSHDDSEIIQIVTDHSRKAHNKTITEKEVRGLMKSEPPAHPEKMIDK